MAPRARGAFFVADVCRQTSHRDCRAVKPDYQHAHERKHGSVLSRYVTGASMIGRTDGVRNSSEKNMRRVIDEVRG